MLVMAGFTALVIVAVAALAVLRTTGGDFTPNDEGLFPAGDKAPGFTAESVTGGGSVSVGEGGAPATMLVFFATWCPHCQREAPVLSELESQYDGLRMIMVGIDGEDNPHKVREFVERYDIESPAVYEPSLGTEYRVSGYPTVYVLNEDNEVIGAHSGEAPREVYEGWIEEAL
ncbi:MAG TPA: TlpA disulfide reductase family protein [Rubrobacteraceae bacterium]|jgi:thiol-disulfide isomerase/thioredoxin|nr:TlpA disulfide reductase family protein [Rubrobacteraceae bacterium]